MEQKLVADEIVDDVSSITDVAEYNPIASGLIVLRKEAEQVQTLDLETTQGNKDARAFRAACVSLRTSLAKIAKEAKLPHQTAVRKLNDDLARLTSMISEIEDPIDQKILAIEERKAAERKAKAEAEQSRVDGHISRIAAMQSIPSRAVGISGNEILQAIEKQNATFSPEGWDEFSDQAMSAHNAVIETLTEMLGKARQAEAERADLMRQQAEIQAQRERQRAEQARINEAAEAIRRKQAEAQAAIDRAAAAQLAEEAAARKKIEAEQAAVIAAREEVDRQKAEFEERERAKVAADDAARVKADAAAKALAESQKRRAEADKKAIAALRKADDPAALLAQMVIAYDHDPDNQSWDDLVAVALAIVKK